MKVFVFLIAFACFIGALLLMGYAFSVQDGWSGPVFFAGILGVVVAFSIPIHLLPRTD